MAHIERIKQTYPIEGADNIEMAQVLDWHVAVKKGEFKAGDLVTYIEVDSIVPDGLPPEHLEAMNALYTELATMKHAKKPREEMKEIEEKIAELAKFNNIPHFEFLRGRKFKIKAVAYNKFKIISQGIIFPVSILPSDKKYKEGQDVTKELGITRIIEDDGDAVVAETRLLRFFEYNPVGKFINKKLMRHKWYREFKQKLKPKGKWHPEFPSKSDETNAQAIFTKMKEKYPDATWYVTEKLEGQNISLVHRVHKVLGLFKVNSFGVCSHSRFLPRYDGSGFWRTVIKLEHDKTMKKIGKNMFVRGEHIGGKIQKNIYGVPENDIYIFDVYDMDTKTLYGYNETVEFCKKHGFKMVPVLDDKFKLPETVQELLDYSNGYSVLKEKALREGIVIRLLDDSKVSFKVRSPKYIDWWNGKSV